MPNDSGLPLYLCLDQGGHASRALIFDANGDVVAQAMREVSTHFPADDRVEQDPEEVVRSLWHVAREAVAAVGTQAYRLRAAGIATQRSSIVCWDRHTGRALSPVLSWQDRRAQAWLAQFSAQSTDVSQRTGLRLSAHYGASKMRWCLDELDAVRAAQRAGRLALGPLVSFLLFRLLDERPLVVDPSNAQRTLLWNLARGDWDASLLERFGVPADVLPAVVATRSAFGHLALADDGIPLTVATGDQAAALYAFGTPSTQIAYVNMGTGAFVQRPLPQPVRVDGLLTGVASVDDDASALYVLEGTVNGAASALAWAAEALALPNLQDDLPQWLARRAPAPMFLNGIGGLGAPYWVADFVSRFTGEGESWEKAVAVAESIVFLLMTNLARMQETGTLQSVVVTGGLAGVDGLCQRLADLCGLPVWRPRDHEATAQGLAHLLGSRAVTSERNAGRLFSPQTDSALRDRYRQWREYMRAALAPAS